MKGRIHLVLGGARSGKSTYAEQMAMALSNDVLYIATAVITDDDMADRIERHKASRPSNWHTLEQYSTFENLVSLEAFSDSEVVLLDCLTVMMTNLMFASDIDFEDTTPSAIGDVEASIKREIDELIKAVRLADKHLVIVSNEVGLGIVPAYKLGSYFRDISGRMNQYVAKLADDVTFIASGLPLVLKKGAEHD
ncbi:MAG TPA: bifunctional adenosylcobinamide kinase/adenosylcobinamide-phosphate guanylyltransferase [Clostridiales bacterium UBA8960]|nr:bifunctional adenosylcobinamide kinase/adenosylcobinamide-phosphate guanylyltransferase [Clostridiales bacterium UBA8960]